MIIAGRGVNELQDSGEYMHKNSKLKEPTFKLKPACAAVLLAFSVNNAEANPLGGNVVSGQASFNSSGNILTVTNTPGAIIHWQDFSIQQNEITRFAQQSASSAVLNRVISNNPSLILGSLQSNGRVFLVNPSGIVFGAGSTVDVAGLVATSLNLSDTDFQSGRHRFTNPSPTGGGAGVGVINSGNLTAQSGGEIYLIAPNVSNSGVITAPNGDILLAAGNSVELVNSLDPNLRVNITAAAGDATNVGQLVASAGNLGLFGAVVKNTGSVSADSATLQGGKIVFRATQRVDAGGTISAKGAGGGEIKILADMLSGTVDVTGTIDASALPSPTGGGAGGGGALLATDGGFIDTSAAHVLVADGARVTTAAPNGKTGTWLIDPTDYTIAAVDPGNGSSYMSNTTLATNLGSSNITIQTVATGGGNGDIFVNDGVTWTTANSLTLNAIRNVNINAAISNSGGGNLIVRADLNGSNTGIILFGGGGTVALTGGGRADLYYNPISYITPTNFAAGMGSTSYTAWMLVNDVGSETGGTLGLQAMSTNLAGNYALGKNIDATATSAWNMVAWFEGFAPIGSISSRFTGTFDGQNHSINGLFINRPSNSYVGLFGYTDGSTIKNVTLTNVNVTGGSFVGGLVGLHTGTIAFSSNDSGSVTGSNSVGGLVGLNFDFSLIDNCTAGSTVSGVSSVGGLVGASQRATISNSSATGNVTGTFLYAGGLLGDSYDTLVSFGTASGTVVGVSSVGGLVGRSGYSSDVTNSSASGNVSGNADVGGLVGFNASNIINSSAVGTVTGTTNVGGLVGNNYWITSVTTTYGIISNSTATGNVTGATQVGGLVGANNFGASILNLSNASGNVTGSSSVGGLVGFNDGSISNANASGNVIGSGATIVSLGGLVGTNTGNLSLSFASGASVGGLVGANIGGLAGYNSGNINTCYSSVALVAGVDSVGGLVGNSVAGNIIDSYVSVGSVSGTSNIGGLVGSHTANIVNSFYDINGVTINGARHVTFGGLYNDIPSSSNGVGQYTDWLFNGNKSLSIANYASLANTATNIYTISSFQGLKDMLGFAGDLGYTFTLANDIALTSGFYVPRLLSSFDGAGFTITNLNLNILNNNLGFFGSTYVGTVSNLILLDASVIGASNVGVLAGSNSNATINAVTVSSSASGVTTVTGTNNVGGLVGNNSRFISNSSVNAGGGSVNVSGVSSVGGLAGGSSSAISDSFVTGATVAGVANIGGLVGTNGFGSTVTNSYVVNATITATEVNVGGLIGGAQGGTQTNSHFNIDTVTTNAGNNVTAGGLYTTQYNDWFNGGVLTPLSIANYSGSLVLQGDGSYGISDIQGMKDMLGFADDAAAYNFSLLTPIIDLTAGFYVPKLTGSFNGNNNVLRNLNLTLPNDDVGLFGVTSVGSLVNNLALLNAHVTGNLNVGALVGRNFGNIDTVFVALNSVDGVSGAGNNVGGLVGQNVGGFVTTSSSLDILASGNISNSFVSGGTVSGIGNVGGLVGNNNFGRVAGSHVDSTAVSGHGNVGGLVGFNEASPSAFSVQGLISNSYVSNGSVTGTGNSLSKNVGGLAGLSSSFITGSYVLNANVNGGLASMVGGLVGSNVGAATSSLGSSAIFNGGEISNSYVSAGTVTSSGNDVGGLVGNNYGGLVDLSYVEGLNVSGGLHVGGLVGNDSGEGWNNFIGVVSNSHVNYSQVTGDSSVGGLIGYIGSTSRVGAANYAAVLNSYVNHGTVSGSVSSITPATEFGGLVGNNVSQTIDNSYVIGTNVSGDWNVGGLAGKNSGSIINTYVNGGNVSGSSSVGGLVGFNASGGTIAFSYTSNGAVTGLSSTGGVVGYNFNTVGNVHDNFWDSSLNTGGTLSNGIGNDQTSLGFATDNGATPLSSNPVLQLADPMLQASYTGWNFGSTGGTWWMVDGHTRPFLRSEWSATIANAHQLQLMDMNPAASYTLSNNLDLATELNNTLSTGMWSNKGFVPIGNAVQFTGTFDGLNHSISNLKINRTDAYVGLFGDVGSVGAVSNVSLVNANVTGGFNVGGLVGHSLGLITNSFVQTSNVIGTSSSGVGGLVGYNGGTINNSFVSGGTVDGGNWTAGGLVGQNSGSINTSYVTGGTVVSGGGNVDGGGVGGLVGYNNTGNILGSYVSGATVTSVASTNQSYLGQANFAGGLVGQSFSGTIGGSYVSNATVTGVKDVGGLVGNNRSIISNSYVTGGMIFGTENVGGLVGNNASQLITGTGGARYVGSISNTYVSGGTVIGTTGTTGGLVGFNDSFNGALVSNSYWNQIGTGGGPTFGIGNDTGILGGTDTGAARLTAAQMQQQSNFTGWDFVNTWRSYNGHSAPLLKSFLTPVSVTASAITGNFTKTYDTLAWSAPALGTLTYSLQSAAGLLHEQTPFGAPVIDAGLYEMFWSDQQGYDISYTAGGLLTVNTASVNVLGITANNATKSYGSTFNFLGNAFTTLGLLGSDSISSVTLTSAGAASDAIVGDYAITPSAAVFGVGSASNYSITYADGVLTVNPVTLTYTATAASRTYGVNDPAFSGTLTGFVQGQTVASATTGTMSFTSTTTSTSNVGSYAISGSGLTANNGNYVFAQAAGNASAFTISPATLTYTANVATRSYGDINPGFTGTVSGFVLSDTQSSATTGTMSFGSSALNTSSVGSYAINGLGLSANNGNYVFAQAASNATAFSISQRIISVTADAASKVYGDADPGSYSVGGAGLAAFDTKASVFSGALSHSGGENQNVAGAQTAPYAITQGTLAANSNYSISSYSGNNLTITQAPLTVKANSPNKILGTNDPLLTYMVSGLKFSDTESATLSGELSRESGDIIGSYAITQGSLALLSSNYSMNYVPGTLRILAPTVVQEITQTSLRIGTSEPALDDHREKEKEREKVAKLAAVSEISNEENGGLAEVLPVCR